TGYSLAPDLHQCHDINECNLNKRICNGGQCNNTLGSYVCMCTEGLRNSLDLSTCLDINECEEMPEICGSGTCENNIGSFSCRCEDGYSVKPAEGPACTDENECTMRTHNCDDNADCINNPVNKTGTRCVDIDECATSIQRCGEGFCVNDVGTYHCVCPDGYMLLPSGKECIDMRRELCYLNYTDGLCSLPMSNEQTRMVCCCSMGQSWGKPCQPCPPPGSRDYILLCGSKPGEFMNPMTNKTEEIDEYKTGTRCVDIDECATSIQTFGLYTLSPLWYLPKAET
ncbi:fibrillin-1-like, partial [Diaphorina citri]|uniref:Fibrillin-1-like n=1 Tax=Diaphorina citri TaxID=121845 RepID=A0A3Q0JK41_DIACI